jgi:hypothetical protein
MKKARIPLGASLYSLAEKKQERNKLRTMCHFTIESGFRATHKPLDIQHRKDSHMKHPALKHRRMTNGSVSHRIANRREDQ